MSRAAHRARATGGAVLFGACLLACSEASPLVPDCTLTQRVDTFVFSKPLDIDLLLVVDNSPHMLPAQRWLGQSLRYLLERLRLRNVGSIRIGVVSSSLGGYGVGACATEAPGDPRDDRAHLLGTLERGRPFVPDERGFVELEPQWLDAGELDDAARRLEQLIEAVGEDGCGYEATLEAWYRFLVDPEPPLAWTTGADGAEPEGVDEELLRQRSAFLRSDSLLAVALLSNENDCSVAPEHALAFGDEPELLAELGPAALRCFDGAARFGRDLLYPLERYVQGLRGFRRGPESIQFIPIVGAVPDDLRVSPSSDIVAYRPAYDLDRADGWPLLLGDPSSGTPPADPLMRESIEPRTGRSPITGEALAPATSQDPLENSVNGHEFAALDELQYACIAPLDEPRACDGDERCACPDDDAIENKPICQPLEGGPATTTQYFLGATPGLRQLELARQLDGGATVASICAPQPSGDPLDPSYGTNPAFESLVEPFTSSDGAPISAARLDRETPDEPTRCVMAYLPLAAQEDACVYGSAAGPLRRTALDELRSGGYCDAGTQLPCDELSVCAWPEATGEAAELCRNDLQTVPRAANGGGTVGWCHLGPDEPDLPVYRALRSFYPDTDGFLRVMAQPFDAAGPVVLACEHGCDGRQDP